MRALPLLLAALPTVAAAFPGTFATADGELPDSGRARVVLARQADVTTLTVAPWVDDAGAIGLVVPIATDDVTQLRPVPHAYVERVENYVAPRLGRVDCDELIVDQYYTTPPGCTSYEPIPEPPARGEDAVAFVGLEPTWIPTEWSYAVVTVDEIQDGLTLWLTTNGLVLPDGVQAQVDAHVAAGGAFLVGVPTVTGDPRSGWLEPLQVQYRDPDFRLPALFGAEAAAGTVQDLVVTAISDATAGGVVVENYPRTFVPDECMVSEDALAEAYEEAIAEALPTTPLPSWLVEYSGPAGRCEPCLGDPLEAYELLDFGWQGDLEDAWVTRLRMRADPAAFDQEVQLAVEPLAATQMHFVERREELEFAFPVCGEGFPQDPGVCPGLDLPDEGGCATTRLPSGWLALALAGLLLARRSGRAAVGAGLLLALTSTPARAEGGHEPAKVEILGSTTLWSTDRVRFDTLERGGPHTLMPMLGVEARAPLPLEKLRRVGVTGGLRGFVGNATPGEPNMPVSFRFFEPHAGLDVRWGNPGRYAITPTARVGMQVALGIVDTTVWRPRATLGALMHVGAGAAVGRGSRPLLIEVQSSVIPRTDGYGTSFHPTARLPGWLYFPGTANLTLLLGVAFR